MDEKETIDLITQPPAPEEVVAGKAPHQKGGKSNNLTTKKHIKGERHQHTRQQHQHTVCPHGNSHGGDQFRNSPAFVCGFCCYTICVQCLMDDEVLSVAMRRYLGEKNPLVQQEVVAMSPKAGSTTEEGDAAPPKSNLSIGDTDQVEVANNNNDSKSSAQPWKEPAVKEQFAADYSALTELVVRSNKKERSKSLSRRRSGSGDTLGASSQPTQERSHSRAVPTQLSVDNEETRNPTVQLAGSSPEQAPNNTSAVVGAGGDPPPGNASEDESSPFPSDASIHYSTSSSGDDEYEEEEEEYEDEEEGQTDEDQEAEEEVDVNGEKKGTESKHHHRKEVVAFASSSSEYSSSSFNDTSSSEGDDDFYGGAGREEDPTSEFFILGRKYPEFTTRKLMMKTITCPMCALSFGGAKKGSREKVYVRRGGATATDDSNKKGADKSLAVTSQLWRTMTTEKGRRLWDSRRLRLFDPPVHQWRCHTADGGKWRSKGNYHMAPEVVSLYHDIVACNRRRAKITKSGLMVRFEGELHHGGESQSRSSGSSSVDVRKISRGWFTSTPIAKLPPSLLNNKSTTPFTPLMTATQRGPAHSFRGPCCEEGCTFFVSSLNLGLARPVVICGVNDNLRTVPAWHPASQFERFSGEMPLPFRREQFCGGTGSGPTIADPSAFMARSKGLPNEEDIPGPIQVEGDAKTIVPISRWVVPPTIDTAGAYSSFAERAAKQKRKEGRQLPPTESIAQQQGQHPHSNNKSAAHHQASCFSITVPHDIYGWCQKLHFYAEDDLLQFIHSNSASGGDDLRRTGGGRRGGDLGGKRGNGSGGSMTLRPLLEVNILHHLHSTSSQDGGNQLPLPSIRGSDTRLSAISPWSGRVLSYFGCTDPWLQLGGAEQPPVGLRAPCWQLAFCLDSLLGGRSVGIYGLGSKLQFLKAVANAIPLKQMAPIELFGFGSKSYFVKAIKKVGTDGIESYLASRYSQQKDPGSQGGGKLMATSTTTKPPISILKKKTAAEDGNEERQQLEVIKIDGSTAPPSQQLMEERRGSGSRERVSPAIMLQSSATSPLSSQTRLLAGQTDNNDFSRKTQQLERLNASEVEDEQDGVKQGDTPLKEESDAVPPATGESGDTPSGVKQKRQVSINSEVSSTGRKRSTSLQQQLSAGGSSERGSQQKRSKSRVSFKDDVVSSPRKCTNNEDGSGDAVLYGVEVEGPRSGFNEETKTSGVSLVSALSGAAIGSQQDRKSRSNNQVGASSSVHADEAGGCTFTWKLRSITVDDPNSSSSSSSASFFPAPPLILCQDAATRSKVHDAATNMISVFEEDDDLNQLARAPSSANKRGKRGREDIESGGETTNAELLNRRCDHGSSNCHQTTMMSTASFTTTSSPRLTSSSSGSTILFIVHSIDALSTTQLQGLSELIHNTDVGISRYDSFNNVATGGSRGGSKSNVLVLFSFDDPNWLASEQVSNCQFIKNCPGGGPELVHLSTLLPRTREMAHFQHGGGGGAGGGTRGGGGGTASGVLYLQEDTSVLRSGALPMGETVRRVIQSLTKSNRTWLKYILQYQAEVGIGQQCSCDELRQFVDKKFNTYWTVKQLQHIVNELGSNRLASVNPRGTWSLQILQYPLVKKVLEEVEGIEESLIQAQQQPPPAPLPAVTTTTTAGGDSTGP